MSKYLLISGSPRKGNTEFILTKISEALKDDTETIFLRQKNIKHCIGCLICKSKPECILKDDMKEILDKIIASEVLIIATPNYFGNVTGLLKDFIDRTHPAYKKSLFEGKKVILIMTGGSAVEKSSGFLSETTAGFIKYQKLDLIGSYCFSAFDSDDLKKDNDVDKKIAPIIQKIKSI